MAWTQKTIFKVEEPEEDPETDENEEARLRDMFRNMPPFIKISSRRAREALVKYEAHKQRYIENLRNNPVYKFVMQVAAFTNEDMEKYWRGKTLAPFMEEHMPQDIKIEKEDVELLVSRAREHAFADLHQFCRPIDAIPVYRPSVIFPKGQNISCKLLGSKFNLYAKTLITPNVVAINLAIKLSEDADVLIGTERPEVTLLDYTITMEVSDDGDLIELPMRITEYRVGADDERMYLKLEGSFTNKPSATAGDNPKRQTRQEFISVDQKFFDISEPKYIYNMGDSEFFQFYKKFLSEKTVYKREDVFDRVLGRNRIGRYVLGARTDGKQTREHPAHIFAEFRKYERVYNDANITISDAYDKIEKAANEEEKQKYLKDFKRRTEQELEKVKKNGINLRTRITELEAELNKIEKEKGEDFDVVGKAELLIELQRLLKEIYEQYRQFEDLKKDLNDERSSGEESKDDPMDLVQQKMLQFKKMVIDFGEGVYDHTAIYKNGKRRRDDKDDEPNKYDSYDRSEYKSLDVGEMNIWANNATIVRWEDKRPEFWFQRYVARWLAEDNVNEIQFNSTMADNFQSKYRRLFNNLRYENGRWIRDLTGLRLSRMLRGPKEKRSKTRIEYEKGGSTRGSVLSGGEGNDSHKTRQTSEKYDMYLAENKEGQDSDLRPCEVPCEVPLDFVEPLFNERFAYWKHNLVLGEYEKRSQYQADLWLQKTPWAIGKLYLMPAIVGHMMEAHVAITSKFSGYDNVELMDLLNSERHSFFFSKLVALCIRTSAILSGKKYGLDKAYMRLNLEKRRIMYSFNKIGPPSRSSRRSQRSVEYRSSTVTRRNRRAFEEATDTATRRSILLGNY